MVSIAVDKVPVMFWRSTAISAAVHPDPVARTAPSSTRTRFGLSYPGNANGVSATNVPFETIVTPAQVFVPVSASDPSPSLTNPPTDPEAGVTEAEIVAATPIGTSTKAPAASTETTPKPPTCSRNWPQESASSGALRTPPANTNVPVALRTKVRGEMIVPPGSRRKVPVEDAL